MGGEEEKDLDLSKPLKLTFCSTTLLLEYWNIGITRVGFCPLHLPDVSSAGGKLCLSYPRGYAKGKLQHLPENNALKKRNSYTPGVTHPAQPELSLPE